MPFLFSQIHDFNGKVISFRCVIFHLPLDIHVCIIRFIITVPWKLTLPLTLELPYYLLLTKAFPKIIMFPKNFKFCTPNDKFISNYKIIIQVKCLACIRLVNVIGVFAIKGLCYVNSLLLYTRIRISVY